MQSTVDNGMTGEDGPKCVRILCTMNTSLIKFNKTGPAQIPN